MFDFVHPRTEMVALGFKLLNISLTFMAQPVHRILKFNVGALAALGSKPLIEGDTLCNEDSRPRNRSRRKASLRRPLTI